MVVSSNPGQFPGENGLVAPGMSCKYDIRFAPDSLKDYDDQISVLTQAGEPLVIPIIARRKPPVLTRKTALLHFKTSICVNYDHCYLWSTE